MRIEKRDSVLEFWRKTSESSSFMPRKTKMEHIYRPLVILEWSSCRVKNKESWCPKPIILGTWIQLEFTEKELGMT